MPGLQKTTYLLMLASMMIFLIACGKQTKETTKAPDGTASSGTTMTREEQKELAANIEADAITMARASCIARTAKKDAERRPESEFYQKKAENLITQRNKVRAEMDARYGKDPAIKQQFEAAIESAKLGLEECKGYSPKKNEGQ